MRKKSGFLECQPCSQVYELINYSEHGTIVDNAIYALDCCRGTSPTEGTPKSSSRGRDGIQDPTLQYRNAGKYVG